MCSPPVLVAKSEDRTVDTTPEGAQLFHANGNLKIFFIDFVKILVENIESQSAEKISQRIKSENTPGGQILIHGICYFTKFW
jgi:hypothetical protein